MQQRKLQAKDWISRTRERPCDRTDWSTRFSRARLRRRKRRPTAIRGCPEIRQNHPRPPRHFPRPPAAVRKRHYQGCIKGGRWAKGANYQGGLFEISEVKLLYRGGIKKKIITRHGTTAYYTIIHACARHCLLVFSADFAGNSMVNTARRPMRHRDRDNMMR